MSKITVVLRRFLKGFIAGGLAAMAAALVPGLVVSNFNDLKTLGFTLLIAFASGGILGLEKSITYVPDSTQV